MMQHADFLIVGAGIAGAAMAYRLAPHGTVLVIDMEDQAGYHTTGRSAAFYAETYGGPKLQPLTTGSKAFLHHPPEGFTDVQLITQLGAIHIFHEGQRKAAEAAFAELSDIPGVEWLTSDDVLARAPYLDPERVAGGINDPDCGNLDVAALHQGFLRGAKKRGAEILLAATLETARHDESLWQVKTRLGDTTAKIIINCAGAWGDDVAARAGVRPIGLVPLRRTIVTIPNPLGLPFKRKGPVVIDMEEEFYFKPEGEGYLVSPADETPSPACDAQPELEDIAVAIDHFERATGATVCKLDAKWAGLRTFSPDRAPVIGFAADEPTFFWNVGQGGYGIQTAPAWSELAALLVRGQPLSDNLIAAKINPAYYRPDRFGTTV